jgi:3-methyl-2-oxobutanoate hydroxymethyltransferase
MSEKVTVVRLKGMKQNKEKITMLTAYDYMMAEMIDESGTDVILVGDSLGNVVLGYENTLPVTMDEMIHHTKAVVRGTKRALVIGDMPFMSYQVSKEDSIRNAGRFLKEAGASGVKLEGGQEIIKTIEKMVGIGIPVMGHLGLTPQSICQLGGYKVQGKDEKTAKKILEDAKALDEAGVFSIVLECIPAELAKEITEAVSVPTISCGAGIFCDGQVLVTHDMLGLFDKPPAKFVKQYIKLNGLIKDAFKEYIDEVKSEKFPTDEYSYH